MTDMVAASDRFASLPPTRTFGDVLVREGEEVDIPVSRGDVIELASLVTTGKSGPAFLSRTCADYAYVVFSGDLDDVVINVRGKLSLGPCAVIGSYQYSSILNVVGDGSAVRIAAQADTSGMPLLAPRRKVVVTGTNNDYEIPTSVGPIWAKTVTMSGYTFQYGNGDYSTFCTP